MTRSPEYIRLGSINGSHGVKGSIKVFSYTDPIDAITSYSPWLLRKGRTEKQVEVVSGQKQGKRLIAQLKGITNRNESDELIGFEIYAAKQSLPELEPGEHYWFQLEGLLVKNEEGVVFGKVDHLFETGANDVMKVKPTDDSVDDVERLIPYVDGEIVRRVDEAAGEIVVRWEADY